MVIAFKVQKYQKVISLPPNPSPPTQIFSWLPSPGLFLVFADRDMT